MATVPTLDTWVAGEKPTALKLNANIRDALNFALNPPSAQVSYAGAGSFTTGAATAIVFDTEEFDTDAMFSGPNTKITIVTPGIYEINATIDWAASATGFRLTQIRLNGTNITTSRVGPSPTSTTTVTNTILWRLVAGDFIEMWVTQNSGGNLNTLTGPSAPRFSAHWTAK